MAPSQPARSLIGFRPVHRGLGPQTGEHGNSSSASWGFPGANPHGEEVEMALEETSCGRLVWAPGTQEELAVSSALQVAQQLPRTLLGLVWICAVSSLPLHRRANGGWLLRSFRSFLEGPQGLEARDCAEEETKARGGCGQCWEGRDDL